MNQQKPSLHALIRITDAADGLRSTGLHRPDLQRGCCNGSLQQLQDSVRIGKRNLQLQAARHLRARPEGRCPTNQDGYYDVVITANTSDGFRRRYAGRIA